MGDRLINSIETFKKSKKMDFDCPFYSYRVVEL